MYTQFSFVAKPYYATILNMKKYLAPLAVVAVLISAIGFSSTVLAAVGCTPGAANCAPIGLPAPVISKIGDVPALICDVINWVFTFLVILTTLFIIIAAFKYLTSAGDPTRVTSANKTLIFAAVAIAVALVAKGIPIAITSFLSNGATATSPFTGACR